MVLASLGYNYGIQSPTGSNPKLLKENYVLSLWTCVGDNRSSTKLHCATLFVGCNPMFFAYNPIVAGTHVLKKKKKNISKSRVLWSEGSGTYPPVKVPPAKGVVVISNIYI